MDLLRTLAGWRDTGASGAVATVVATWHSAPQPVGARLLVGAEGALAGSVSGGCVEADVALAAHEVMRQHRPRLLRYGVTAETAWSVGLPCGGEIVVWVEPAENWFPILDALEEEWGARRTVGLATALWPEHPLKVIRLEDGRYLPEPIDTALRDRLEEAVRAVRDSGESAAVPMPALGGTQAFVELISPPPRLLIVGAVHIGQVLSSLARTMGFDVVVIDPRTELATAERFPAARRLIQEWPDRALENLRPDADTYVAVISHDPKLDEPALAAAVMSQAAYVGVLGSTRTQDARRRALRARGLPEAAIARIHGPIGLSIGAQGAAEIALSIMAEIVAVRRGRRSTR